MKSLMMLMMAGGVFGLSSCVLKDPEPKPVGPTSSSSRMPWNVAQPGHGGGQLGLLPQNQYRR